MATNRYDPDDEGMVSAFLVLQRPYMPFGVAFDLETALEQAEALRQKADRPWRESQWCALQGDSRRRIRTINNELVCEIIETKVPVSVRDLMWSNDSRRDSVADALRQSVHEAETHMRNTDPTYDWIP